MEHTISPRQLQVLTSLSNLPQKILSVHGIENITEFVLHDLCAKNCFDLEKAAYFVDNPDFNYCKGVAGYHKNEEFEADDIWQKPSDFSTFMRTHNFNQKVRNIQKTSIGKEHDREKKFVKDIAQELAFANPSYLSWNLRHDNNGILIFEPQNAELSQQLSKGFYFLSFCPIF